jgi:hypothetical protein
MRASGPLWLPLARLATAALFAALGSAPVAAQWGEGDTFTDSDGSVCTLTSNQVVGQTTKPVQQAPAG